MAKKIKLTRPELKKHRDALQRFQRYLPMLKLKQQQLQMMVRGVKLACRKAKEAVDNARAVFEPYKAILSDRAGVNVDELAVPSKVNTKSENIAGVVVPVFKSIEFPPASYSLFATPPWVDSALKDMRTLNSKQSELEVRQEEQRLLERELIKIVQRVNLFEKLMIPQAREAIRRIRIALGDEMTAAVGRAKIAKGKIVKSEATIYGGKELEEPADTATSPSGSTESSS